MVFGAGKSFGQSLSLPFLPTKRIAEAFVEPIGCVATKLTAPPGLLSIAMMSSSDRCAMLEKVPKMNMFRAMAVTTFVIALWSKMRLRF